MAAAVSFTEEFTSPIPAPRLFKALILDADNLLPKIVPQAIKSIETIEGNGGPGTIKKLNFGDGTHKFAKHRVDVLDKEKMIYVYTLVDGGEFMDKIESITYEMKLESSPDGGCKGKNISKYLPKPGVQIQEEQIKDGKEKAAGVFKAVEAYLQANPDAYA